MHADLDLLYITVYCTADDLLPERRRNARRRLTDAEVVTLCVSQVLMGIPSDRRFLKAARNQLGHLFPYLPSQHALHKRRVRLGETLEWLTAVFAGQSPGAADELLLLDSTPVECGRSLETAPRSQLAEVCGYGYSSSHSRWFWGMRLHLLCPPDGTPRAAALSALTGRSVRSRCRCSRMPSAAARRSSATRATPGKSLPTRSNSSAERSCGRRAATNPSVSRCWPRSDSGSSRSSAPAKDLLSLERHGARTLPNLLARVGVRLLALAACISLNHKLGRPSRAIVDYTA